MVRGLALSGVLLCACGVAEAMGGGQAAASPAAVPPVLSTSAAQHGAVIVSLAAAAGMKIHYTVDGTAPTAQSQIYEAPFLVARDLTVEAIAVGRNGSTSIPVRRSFAVHIPPDTLVWSDEFSGASGKTQPDPGVWTYDTGNNGFGNHELEEYCPWGSNAAPCSAADPNAYVGEDGYLHIVARETSPGIYTSARMKTQGLFSVQYGRIEFRARVPEAAGLWPAGWLLGNNIATVNWPACGEQDVLERVNAAKTPDWNEGSIHGVGFVGDAGLGTVFHFPAGQTAAGWHTYGMVWKKGSVAYYVDDPAHPYVTYTTADLAKFSSAAWPFDAGQSNFLLLNLAVGGDWPGPPNASTAFPAEMLVDYVRIYTN